ncbi:XRE family transcriptional regulator [Nonomuraea sp. NPDC050790]|uniref:XRE family transcriptional regulator n=1 Tax=Nonomuraea sp. NPDC050790 TaxID=3364371 RepID=UPI003787B27D
MGKVVRAYRTHLYHGKVISQATAASWLYLTQSQLSRIESGPPVQDMDRCIQWAHTLRIPADLLWFALPGEEKAEDHERPTVAHLAEDGFPGEEMSELLRRMFLKRGLAAITLPAMGLEELAHIVAALDNARRYSDLEVVGHFQIQLATCAAKDRERGPKQSIPLVLGLMAAIEHMAREAQPAVRRALLQTGAHAAEFAGWLYRDIAVPEMAGYWRDRAVEWAQAAGDFPMQGYVLLKKSQAAWDGRDALRMLTLAEAAQAGPWSLPLRVRAEATQQEARGHAMLSGDLAVIESKLSEARELLAEDTEATGIAAHYDEALFGLQCAICYCEAQEPARALELYEEWLSPDAFSRRDYGYFLALKSETLASAGAPDAAASTGLEALRLARETTSARTHQEVLRLVEQLRPWRDRERVRELAHAVLA